MCVFCKIIQGDIPSYKVYEDEKVLAILDISQATLGHTLVMPKQHIETIFDLDLETGKHLFEVVTKISKAYQEKLEGLAGLNLLNNNLPRAGQTVPHYHIHIIPRYENDDLIDMQFTNHSNDINFEQLLNKIKING